MMVMIILHSETQYTYRFFLTCHFHRSQFPFIRCSPVSINLPLPLVLFLLAAGWWCPTSVNGSLQCGNVKMFIACQKYCIFITWKNPGHLAYRTEFCGTPGENCGLCRENSRCFPKLDAFDCSIYATFPRRVFEFFCPGKPKFKKYSVYIILQDFLAVQSCPKKNSIFFETLFKFWANNIVYWKQCLRPRNVYIHLKMPGMKLSDLKRWIGRITCSTVNFPWWPHVFCFSRACVSGNGLDLLSPLEVVAKWLAVGRKSKFAHLFWCEFLL